MTTAAAMASPPLSLGTRSPVYGRHAMVASSQPLATEAGYRILREGGNAVDAAIAVAAALNVTEPCSTGIGGDCFLLFYDAAAKTVRGLNGSGRSPAALTIERAHRDLPDDARFIPRDHGHAVTVPGAVAGWVDAVETWGSLPLSEILAPAIALAREGFPVSPICAAHWARGKRQLERSGPSAQELLLEGRPPRAGEVFCNPTLANSLEAIAQNGKQGFYEGRVAEEIVRIVQEKGGVLSCEDLVKHSSTFVTPISTTFRGIEVHEIPPNGQGLAALLALNVLDELLPSNTDEMPTHNSPEYLHLLIEALRLAFADAKWYVSDLEHNPTLPIQELLSKEYARSRAAMIRRDRAAVDPQRGSPELSCDTVSFQVVDAQGNAVSMVNSNYEGFGTGFIPAGCGFTLQNRGSNFCLDDSAHPNVLAPRKRPYHTIIPAITTFPATGDLHASFTVMGAFMQPQGHVQVLCNLLCHGMNPQETLDAPRFCIDAKDNDNDGASRVFVESGMTPKAVEALATIYGHHHVQIVDDAIARAVFGRGQIITRDPITGVLCAGSDGRADGCAMGW